MEGTLRWQECSQGYALHRLGRDNGFQQKAEILTCSLLLLTKQRHLLSQVSGWGNARTGNCCSNWFYPSAKQRMGLEKIWTNTLNISPQEDRNLFTLQQQAAATEDTLLNIFFIIQQYDKERAFPIFLYSSVRIAQ